MTSESGAVEAMAVAMCNAAWADVGEDWSLAGEEQQAEFRLMARAAIDALAANISIDMGLAGAAEVNKQMRGPGAKADYHAAVDSFRAMLTAAKGERG